MARGRILSFCGGLVSFAVLNFLRAHGLHVWEGIIQKQHMTVDLIAALPLSDLVAALPAIPAGILCEMQSNAKKWLETAVHA